MWNFQRTFVVSFFVVIGISLRNLSASPIPGIHTVHSLATYDTTNSYWYSKHLGLDYLLPKIASRTLVTSAPYKHQNVVVLPQATSQVSSELLRIDKTSQPSLISQFPLHVNYGKGSVPSLSLYLAPPKQDAFITKLLYGNVKPVNNPVSQLNVVSGSDPSLQNGGNNDFSQKLGAIQIQSSSSAFEPSKPKDLSGSEEKVTSSSRQNKNKDVIQLENNSILNPNENPVNNEAVDSVEAPGAVLEESYQPNPETQSSNPELLKLYQKIAHLGNSANSSPDEAGGSPDLNVVKEPALEMQSRQDSTLEQPIPFFQQQPSPRPSFSNVFNGDSSSSQVSPAESIPQEPRSSVNGNNNRLVLRPPQSQSSQVPPPRLQFPIARDPQSIPSGAPFPLDQSPGLNPSQGQSQQFPPPRLQFPFNGGLQNPSTGVNGQSPPEPENGYNPFHLSENYPEPPYESEFANLPPLENEPESSSGRSLDRPDLSPPINSDQNTLRNVRTEELIGITQRKPVPPDCTYNTISLGPNGEDCVQRKRRQLT